MSFLFRIIYCLMWPFFRVVYPSRVIGRENIPEGGAVICANHSSNADPLLVVYALQFKTSLRVMAKEEMIHWPLVGWVLNKADIMVWVKRGKADIGAIKSALKTLKSGRKMLIFPQGTRSDDIGEGKTGAAMIAIRGEVPILPVYVPVRKPRFRRTTVVIGVPYMPFTEDRKANIEDYKRATEDLMARIAALEETV